jgi:enamidase
MLRMATLLASFGGLPAELAWCCGTGNVAHRRGLSQGILAPGRPADLVFMDRPGGSPGDDVLGAMAMGNIPGIAAVMIDGKMRTGRSRSTPPSARVPVI